ncbi:MAG: BamA/TamA family outer membrane protein [Bacteroidota bacterium]
MILYLRVVVCALAVIASGNALVGQIELFVEGEDFELKEPNVSFEDTSGIYNFLQTWIEEQRLEAHWEASVDSLYQLDSVTWKTELYKGPAYKWERLGIDSIPRSWLQRSGYRRRNFRNRVLDHNAWVELRDSLVVFAARDGYPFASVGLGSVLWSAPGRLSADISLDTGPLITIGELRIPESARVKARFLERYLGLQEGTVYNERRIRRLPDLLRQLPYLQLKGSPKISFQSDQAIIELPIDRKPASRFDFVIGVLPNATPEGGLLITGEVNAELQNGLGTGERIAVRFEQLQPRTQELDVQLEFPYPLDLPFDLNLGTEIFRRDTQFINLGWRIGGAYRWQADNQVQVFWVNRRTNLLGINAQQLLASQRLPDTLDLRRNLFGFKLNRRLLDRRFAPRRGEDLSLSIAAGTRRIRRNGRIEELGLGELYDSLQTRGSTIQLETDLLLYRPGPWGTVIYGALRAGALLGEAEVYPSEQYRLGGAQLLRGFNEQQIFASRFALATLEWRLPLGGQAFLYGFGDWAYIDARTAAEPELDADFPLGFGAGINFETRAGVFAFSLALGRRTGERIDLGAPKVHFGYVSLF